MTETLNVEKDFHFVSVKMSLVRNEKQSSFSLYEIACKLLIVSGYSQCLLVYIDIHIFGMR